MNYYLTSCNNINRIEKTKSADFVLVRDAAESSESILGFRSAMMSILSVGSFASIGCVGKSFKFVLPSKFLVYLSLKFLL